MIIDVTEHIKLNTTIYGIVKIIVVCLAIIRCFDANVFSISFTGCTVVIETVLLSYVTYERSVRLVVRCFRAALESANASLAAASSFATSTCIPLPTFFSMQRM